MNIDKFNGTTVFRRTTDYVPPPSVQTWLVGHPLSTADAPHQTIGKAIGLAIFASDALSSTAYATQEMLVILIAAGSMAMGYSIPISIAIVLLLTILTLSYEQTIHAYPDGGGAYIVSRDNLGEYPALIAAAALLTDYILTVSVSISSAVAQITSALPLLYHFRIEIAVLIILLMMLINLRGVKESGTAFAIPSYFFVFAMYTVLIVGLFRYFSGTLTTVVAPPAIDMPEVLHPITFLLILRAFSNGTSAVTGVEAISNGVTAFKEPRSRNAGVTLIWMSIILGSLLLGITFLSVQTGSVPSESETVISQLVRTIYNGRGVFYVVTIVAVTIILCLAANTAFAGFPRLGALVALDRYLPHQFAYRGSRLVYSSGIIALALIAGALVVIFQAKVTNLIPLYAIGVFMSFTLSQAGMAHRWWKTGLLKPGEERVERGSTLTYKKGWQTKMIINGAGSITTFIVMLVFAATKFQDGAWIVIFLIPIMVSVFLIIHQHYQKVAQQLSLEDYGVPPLNSRRRVILMLGGVHKGTLEALQYARTLSDDITAVHVSIEPEESKTIQKKWESWGDGVRLVILESPYRLFIEPVLEYIEEIHKTCQPNEVITIIVPQFVPSHWLHNFLHTRTADTLRKVLLNRSDIVITEVPYQIN